MTVILERSSMRLAIVSSVEESLAKGGLKALINDATIRTTSPKKKEMCVLVIFVINCHLFSLTFADSTAHLILVTRRDKLASLTVCYSPPPFPRKMNIVTVVRLILSNQENPWTPYLKLENHFFLPGYTAQFPHQEDVCLRLQHRYFCHLQNRVHLK